MSFTSDFKGAIVVEAEHYGYSGVKNLPLAICLHTAEEVADENFVTPWYFHNMPDGRVASSQYAVSWTGFVYQCVPESEGAYANALEGYPWSVVPWAKPAVWGGYLNCQTISIELEGQAKNVHLTMPRGGPQWVALVRLMADICIRRPDVKLERTFGHYLVSNQRSDPGQLNIGWLIEDTKALLAGAAKDWFDMATKAELEAVVKPLNDEIAKLRQEVDWLVNTTGHQDRFFRAPHPDAPHGMAIFVIKEAVFYPAVGRPHVKKSYHHIGQMPTFLMDGGMPFERNVVTYTAAQRDLMTRGEPIPQTWS